MFPWSIAIGSDQHLVARPTHQPCSRGDQSAAACPPKQGGVGSRARHSPPENERTSPVPAVRVPPSYAHVGRCGGGRQYRVKWGKKGSNKTRNPVLLRPSSRFRAGPKPVSWEPSQDTVSCNQQQAEWSVPGMCIFRWREGGRCGNACIRRAAGRRLVRREGVVGWSQNFVGGASTHSHSSVCDDFA